MSEQALPSEAYVCRKFGVKLPPAKNRVEAAGPTFPDPLDVTDTSARDLLMGLACYGFLCSGLGMMVGWMLWGPK